MRGVSPRQSRPICSAFRVSTGPAEQRIDDYEEELDRSFEARRVRPGRYGFKRDGKWTEASVRYTRCRAALVADDDPGKIRPNLDVAGAFFTSFLDYNSNWHM